jgi:hypothetical protein
MKGKTKFLAFLGVAAVFPSLSAPAQNEPRGMHREITVWIPAKLGTLIGGGYASSYLTNIRSKTIASEDPKLRHALDRLDDLGMRSVRGFGLVPAAVSWQIDVPIHTLVEQQAQTDLSYGELLMVNALAGQSGQSFQRILSLRTKSRNWSEIANQLGVDTDLIVTKANAASQRIRNVELRYRHKPQQADTGVSFTSVNPHASMFSRLH